MRLHLLEHDPFDYSRTNITRWAARKGHRIRQTYVCDHEELPGFDDFDRLMVMGGSQHAWDEEANPWLQDEKAFIREAVTRNKRVLGICLGAQLLAEALGGRVFPNKQKEIGWYEIEVTSEGRESFLFENIPDRFTTFHWHSDHFSLPPGCVRLARSVPTPNQAFVSKEHPVVGLQFHPEYTREMVRYFAKTEGAGWVPDLFVSGKEEVLGKTDRVRDTYWLMEALLDNLERAVEKGVS